MKGAPASFPMQQEHVQLQKYMEFSDSLLVQADAILQTHFNGSREYVGIHLRNGEDWVNQFWQRNDVVSIIWHGQGL